MRRYTQRELRNLCAAGYAQDITNTSGADVLALGRRCERVGYSSGVYGINGGLLQDTATGEQFAIIARNSTLMRLF